MKKQLVILEIAVLLICVGLSGCNEQIQNDKSSSSSDNINKSETGFEWFQIGNNQSIVYINTNQSKELKDNRIAGFTGGGWSPEGEPWDSQYMVNDIINLGLKRFRFSINNQDCDKVNWQTPELSIDPNHKDLINSLVNNNIIVTYNLIFWDKELGEDERIYPRFKTETEIQRYLDFVRIIVNEFKNQVQIFEIWNEPNVKYCLNWIEVDDYLHLVKQTVPVIKEISPEAKIQVGGTTYLNDNESREYLYNILNSDIMPLVDIVSWHPMYGTSPEFDSEYYYKYPTIVQEIKDLAYSNGFRGEYEADEINIQTENESEFQEFGEGPYYNSIVAAKYQARAIIMHLGMNISVGNAGVPTAFISRSALLSVICNLCTVMEGFEPFDLPVDIKSKATNIQTYTFKLSNRDKLIALWTDGIAIDNDTGVRANLFIQNITSEDVIGIDVLEGFNQSLIIVNKNGNLQIGNLLVRDYPLIIHIKI